MKRLTTEEFVCRAKEVWGDRWKYDKVEYLNNTTPVLLECPEHGEFTQTPKSHLRGEGACRSCRGILNEEAFLKQALEVWGDRWDYSSMEFSTARDPLQISCPTHGPFTQVGLSHLKGYVGCPECSERKKKPAHHLEAQAKEVWGDRWDFSKSQWGQTRSEVVVICPQHGGFTQNTRNLLRGDVGCRPCKGIVSSSEEFMERAKVIWGDRWDYSALNFRTISSKVTLRCPLHGEFQQMGSDHLRGFVGCPSCSNAQPSALEQDLREYIQSLGIEVQSSVTGLLDPPRLELDMYIPSQKKAFEFNGVYWHSEKFRPRDAHLLKYLAAKEQGIDLYQIWEDDWHQRREVVEKHVANVLGVSVLQRISARQTEVVEVTTEQAKNFFEANHIQGFVGSGVYLSLQHLGELVACASFRKRGEDYELTRYATSNLVRGGHSKLVTYFERHWEYRNLITFADLTYGDGSLYRTTGWVEDGTVSPDYMYLVGGVRKHKFGYRVDRFRRDPALKFEEGLTERELAELNGLLRVYDAGKIRFKKPHPILMEDQPTPSL